MNKILLIIGAVILLAVIGVAYWLISPLWRKVALNEALPEATDTLIQDNLATMDENKRIEFEQRTMETKDKAMKENEGVPANQPLIISRAGMVARAHEVQGTALLVKAGDETYLRFENLKTINGPDLRIYLSSGLNDNDIVDLGPIRATEGNVNYVIPAGTDLTKYKNAMIWCRAFGVLFSYAQF